MSRLLQLSYNREEADFQTILSTKQLSRESNYTTPGGDAAWLRWVLLIFKGFLIFLQCIAGHSWYKNLILTSFIGSFNHPLRLHKWTCPKKHSDGCQWPHTHTGGLSTTSTFLFLYCCLFAVVFFICSPKDLENISSDVPDYKNDVRPRERPK